MAGIVYADGSVTLDGDVHSNAADDVSSINISHTTGTGANRLMLVGVSWNCGGTARSISSVTFTPGGGSATALDEVDTEQTGSQARYSAIYSLLDPPSGTSGTVTVTFSGSVSNGIVAGVANFAGVDQTTPLGTPQVANGDSAAPSVGLTGLNGDELVFDNVFQGASGESQTLTAGSGQNQRWNAWIANARAASSTEQATGSSVTMSWTAGSSSYWAIVAIPINPVAGPTYNLTMAVDPVSSGTTDPSVGIHPYAGDTVVPVEATATPGYLFDHWSGALSGSDNPTSITMDGDKSVTAHFTAFTPVTLDGAVYSGTADDVSSIGFNHTTGTGTNRLMLVGVSWNAGSNDRTISSATFTPSGESAIALDPVITQQLEIDPYYRYSAIYSLLDPPSGEAGTVTVTFSNTVSDGIVAGAANFVGVDQTTPLGTPGGDDDESTAPSVTLTGLNGDELVFDTVFQGATDSDQTLTAGSSQTERWNAFIGHTRAAASTEQATGTSVTMSWTAVSSSYWVIAAVPINPVSTYHDLTLNIVGNGSVTLDPAGGTYGEGTEVELTAAADYGSYFKGWSDDLSDNTSPETITMDDDKYVTATFEVGPTVTRTLPGEILYPDDVFDVTIQFTAPTNDFNSVGITDIAPTGWAVAVNKAWCTPPADGGTAVTNTAEYGWLDFFNDGTAFTVVYKVTVPTGATSGTYVFPDGQLEYFVAGNGHYYVDITGDDEVNVSATPLDNTWYLNDDGTMYKEYTENLPGTVPISDGGSYVWISDETALGNFTFPGGEWSGQITIDETLVSGDEFSVTIGSYNGGFNPATNGTVDLVGNGSKQVFDFDKTVDSFTVPTGDYLALKIENKSGGSTNPLNVKTGLAHSYCTAPDTDPNFPLPEWASGLLMGLGLAALGVIIWFRRRKRSIKKYV